MASAHKGGSPSFMVIKLHQFASNRAPPEIHGTLAEVGVMLDMDNICSDHDNGAFFLSSRLRTLRSRRMRSGGAT
eukprot:253428-Chlamydomonas_euryale.AAC.1